MSLDELLRPFPSVITQQVVWGDMDAFGHVNNVVYFRYFENGRIAYLTALGAPELLRGKGLGVVLGATDCRFRAPLTYPDTIAIGVSVTSIGSDRFVMRQAVISHKLGRVAAEGEALTVMFDFDSGRKAALPDALRQRIEVFEGRGAGGEG